MNEISQRLLHVITNSKLSYADLERKTGIAKSSIQRYANAKTKKIPIDVVKLIADATNSSAAWIMGWSDEESFKKNDAISDIFVRLRKDDDFREVVSSLYNLSPEQLNAVKNFLLAFK